MRRKARSTPELLPVIFVLICSLVFALSTHGIAAEYQFGSIPSWVKKQRFEDPSQIPQDDIVNGCYILLVDTQSNPKFGTEQYFKHFAQKVVNRQGVEYLSQISITFDPSYQSVFLHTIKVHRQGRIFSQLSSRNINVLQREEGLEAQIFDGSKTVNVILDDIRIGDVVEYAYTLHGNNPVFDGTYSHELGVQWRSPVYRFYHRLLWPASQPLVVKNHKTRMRPRLTMSNGVKEYIFSADEIAPIIPDSDLPAWYSPYPWIQFSEAQSWSEVAQWGVKLFTAPQKYSSELQAKINEIATANNDLEQRVLSSLRFVQDEIRYMGMEDGLSSHFPHDPSTVLRRRFGDCKDKTLLLQTMLSSMGIESYPALVNTYNDSYMFEWAPTKDAFNHVILMVRLGDQAYWVDPTQTYQRGTLEYHAQVDFAAALILDGDTKELTPISSRELDTPKRETKEYFIVSGEFGTPSTYSLESIYRGSYADVMRARFAHTSKGEVEKNYLNYYASVYPEISMAGPIETMDDQQANVFTVKESYSIPKHWHPSEEDENVMVASFYPLDLYNLIEQPKTRKRSMPLGIAHPIHYRQTTTVQLPDEWDAKTFTDRYEDEAVKLEYTVGYKNKILTMYYDYRSKTDHLNPVQALEHISYSEKMEDELGYVIYTSIDDSEPEFATSADQPAGTAVDQPVEPEARWYDQLNWSLLLLGFFALVVALFSAFKVYCYTPGDEPVFVAEDAKPIGIRGWLVFTAMALLAQPVVLVSGFSFEAFGNSTWNVLTTPGSEAYHVMWQPLLLFELVFNIFFFVFSLLMLVLFFQKRRSFPKVYITYLVIMGIMQLVDHFGAQAIPFLREQADPRDFFILKRYLVMVIVWSLYFTKSQRVKNTFVRERATT